MGDVSIYQTHPPIYGSYGVSLSPEGAILRRMINKTGSASVKGTLVSQGGTVARSFIATTGNSADCIGVVYENGIADGEECWIAVGGRAQVLLKDSTAATAGYWVKVSDTTGRADATVSGPPGGDVSHWREIGHCDEDVSAGTNKLAYVHLHFN